VKLVANSGLLSLAKYKVVGVLGKGGSKAAAAQIATSQDYAGLRKDFIQMAVRHLRWQRQQGLQIEIENSEVAGRNANQRN